MPKIAQNTPKLGKNVNFWAARKSKCPPLGPKMNGGDLRRPKPGAGHLLKYFPPKYLKEKCRGEGFWTCALYIRCSSDFAQYTLHCSDSNIIKGSFRIKWCISSAQGGTTVYFRPHCRRRRPEKINFFTVRAKIFLEKTKRTLL